MFHNWLGMYMSEQHSCVTHLTSCAFVEREREKKKIMRLDWHPWLGGKIEYVLWLDNMQVFIKLKQIWKKKTNFALRLGTEN